MIHKTFDTHLICNSYSNKRNSYFKTVENTVYITDNRFLLPTDENMFATHNLSLSLSLALSLSLTTCAKLGG